MSVYSIPDDSKHRNPDCLSGRTLAKFNQLKRSKRFNNFIMLVWVQGSIFHIAAGSHPVQESWGSQDSLYRGQIQKLLQCCHVNVVGTPPPPPPPSPPLPPPGSVFSMNWLPGVHFLGNAIHVHALHVSEPLKASFCDN